MQRTLSSPLPAPLLALLLFTPGPVLAHQEHCHVKGADGKLEDVADAKTKKGCAAKGGTWFHHHQHCHKASADGKLTDLPGAKNEKACTEQGGQWQDHGHDESKSAVK